MELNLLFRPSEIHNVMPNGKGKSNLEKYNDILAKIENVEQEFKVLKNKKTKKAMSLLERAHKYCVQLEVLRPVRHLPHLSEGVKKHLRNKMIELKYGRYKEFENKYTTKGKACEEAGITLYSLLKGRVFENNKTRIQNDYFSGEIDIPWFTKKVMVAITDIKNSYSIHTFFDNLDGIKSANKYQGLGYLDLNPTVKKYHVANVLIDNTADAILLDLHRESYKWEEGDTPAWRELQILKTHVYSQDKFDEFIHMRGCAPVDDKSKEVYNSFVELPREDRLIEHTFERDEDEINAVKKRIDECRLFMEMTYGIKHVPIKLVA